MPMPNGSDWDVDDGNWTSASNNYTEGNWTGEMSINYTKLNISAGKASLGIAFYLEDIGQANYAAAQAGVPIDEIIERAAAAGYDVSSHRPALEKLAAGGA